MLQYTRQPKHVYLELEEPYKTVLTVATTSMHSTVVVREVFSGLRESCYIIVMVVQEREETHSRTWGVPDAELKSGWEAHPALRTAAGDVYMPVTLPLATVFHTCTLPAPWPPNASLALSRAVFFTVGRKVLCLMATFSAPLMS